MGRFDRFEIDGYAVLNLDNLSAALEVRHRLTQELRSFCGSETVTLENYHKVVGDDDNFHISVQSQIAEKFRAERWHESIFRRNLSIFTELLGPDLDLEAEPYLRVARPGKPQDNIGYHRDTIYGASAYELSVIIPFVDLNEAGTLRVHPGSHLKAEADIHFTRMDNYDPTITKGSTKHKLGFPYAPQVLDKNYPLDQLVPVPMRIGQILMFGLSMLHGSVLNGSDITRWSCDARIKNTFAPVNELRAKRFIALGASPVTKAVEGYLKANKRQDSLVNESYENSRSI